MSKLFFEEPEYFLAHIVKGHLFLNTSNMMPSATNKLNPTHTHLSILLAITAYSRYIITTLKKSQITVWMTFMINNLLATDIYVFPDLRLL